MTEQKNDNGPQLDLSDVDKRVGQPIGAGQLQEPCNRTDIRRWVMAMDYVNPLHWDLHFARRSKFGDLIAPQSMAVSLDYGHGCTPAAVGYIPNSHLIFGGEEWWWYGHHIRPGDKLFQDRRFLGYKIRDTKFAGPTMFSTGETVHKDAGGNLVAKVHSTAIRYLADEAEKRGMYENTQGVKKTWTEAELREVDRLRHHWLMSNREGRSPHFNEVKVGDKLTRRVIGPHSIASFTTEYRAFIFNIWGTFDWVTPEGVEDPWVKQDAGWKEGFFFDYDLAEIDPRAGDGLYLGPSRGHIDDSKAGEIGMARAYGYGATMAAWNTDYLAFWAGHDGLVRHAKSEYRGPAFEGDVTYLEGVVVDKFDKTEWGFPLVQIEVTMTNQDGAVLVKSVNEVQLPY